MALQQRTLSGHNIMTQRVGNGGVEDAEHVTKKIPHPPSTRFHEDHAKESDDENHDDDDENNDFDDLLDTPTAKRQKLYDNRTTTPLKMKQLSLPTSTRSPIASPLRKSRYTPSPQKKKASPQEPRPKIDELEDDSGSVPPQTLQQEPQSTELENALLPIQADAEAIEAYETLKAAEEAEKAEDDQDTLETRMKNRSWTRGRSSIYVDAFNFALTTVLADENHLFDDAEKQVFKYWEELNYESQYLYVRLFLRKTSAWFRVGKLGYYSDIADVEAAVQDLQKERTLPKTEEDLKRFPGEMSIPDEAMPLGDSFTFAERSEDAITTWDEASGLVLLDELKVIANEARVNGKNKTELLKNLRRTSGKQKGLRFLKRSETEDSYASDTGSVYTGEDEKGSTPDGGGSNTPTNDENRDEHFKRKILEQTGQCIRLSLIPLKLFERVHLVFYRSTEWTEKSLTTIVLAKIARRNFPDYIVSRSSTIFESRSLLLEFEASLRTQFRVDSIVDFTGTPPQGDFNDVLAIFEAVYPRWQALVAAEQQKEDRLYESGEGAYLRRFSPAWVYTRIVHKALPILGRYKDHLREHRLHCELLSQKLFHAARRGAWYSRKALLEEHYMYALQPSAGYSEEANKKYWKRIALRTCEQGLQDNECHVIYHYDLQKRIKKIEKQLRIPKREQHDFGHVGLLKAHERDVEGVKIEKPESENSAPSLRRRESTEARSRSRSRDRNDKSTPPAAGVVFRGPSTKTIWLDTLDTGLPVSVESMCLSHYRRVLGYKGYHSEGGILRTLFGLLFYEVLFSVYIPNVFQTAYQTCPLDLHSDAFYSARISEINSLINRIGNGEAETILRETWDLHWEKKTCIVGVRWEKYELEDLIEIVNCWDGHALGIVMRVFAQEYGGRGGGVHDLFLWKVDGDDSIQNGLHEQTQLDDDDGSRPTKADGDIEDGIELHPSSTTITSNTTSTTKQSSTSSSSSISTILTIPNCTNPSTTPKRKKGKVMFAEVKSENDRLSDTQRLWISVLLNAGVEVELCHAIAGEVIYQ